MLYEEFERLNCMHIKELVDQTNQHNNNLLKYNRENQSTIMDECNNHVMENDFLRMQFNVNGSCLKKGTTDFSQPTMCHGFECSVDDFYQQPDRLNTFHNYLVLEDELVHKIPVSCVKNHQYFNNWTRRKNPVKREDTCPNPLSFFDKYLEEIPIVSFKPCKTDKLNYSC